MRKLALTVLAAVLVLTVSGFAQPGPSGFGDMNHSLVFTPQGGLLFPAGDFSDRNDMGFSLGGGLEYFISPQVSLGANVSYLDFSDQTPPGPGPFSQGANFYFLGATARGFLFHDTRLNPYVRAAGGLYEGDGLSSAGIHFGPGLLYRVSEKVGLFTEGTVHFVFESRQAVSSTANFFGLTAGLSLTIPTGSRRETVMERPVQREKRPEPRREAEPAEISLSPIFFDFDKYNLDDDAVAILNGHVEVLRAHPGLKVEIEGYCGEQGSDEYNIWLGHRRADAVKDYFIGHGIDGSRLTTISYGKRQPPQPNYGKTLATNRRVQFKIMSR